MRQLNSRTEMVALLDEASTAVGIAKFKAELRPQAVRDEYAGKLREAAEAEAEEKRKVMMQRADKFTNKLTQKMSKIARLRHELNLKKAAPHLSPTYSPHP